MSLPTVTVKNSGLFPQSKQWAAVTIQNRLRMEPPHQTGPTCALKSNSTCHGQDPGCASVPPTILGSPILVPGSTFPSDERHFRTMVLDLFFFCYVYFLNWALFQQQHQHLNENVLKWERILKKHRGTLLGRNSSLPITLLIYTKKSKTYVQKFNELKMLKPST